MSRREKKQGKDNKDLNKDEELFVFGYASKLFRDDKSAEYHDKGRHLISWQGDSSLQIDRYDCRLLFTDRFQFETLSDETSNVLSPEDRELERLCDEERYLELTTNTEEYDIEQEEEMKRFKEAISKDSGYSAVGFSYENSGSCQDSSNQIEGPEPQPFIKFVAPEELEVPDGMEIPDTDKMNAIIEKTAMFVSHQGTQMEILVKAKQAGNPQFDFLNFDNWLNPYYKHVLKRISQKLYTPQVQAVPSPKQQEAEESDPESDEDDSDGEFELHPLLTASHRSLSNTPNSSTPSSPTPQSIGQQTERLYNISTDDQTGYYDEVHYVGYQWTEHDQANYYDSEYSSVPVSTQYMPAIASSSNSTLSAMNLLPPPPPPPGEGPLEDEWPESEASRPQQRYPQPIYTHPGTTSIPATDPRTVITTGYPTIMHLASPIVPPPPDIQPIIDKLANYVAKNGPDFENIIKAKDDPRFTFVHPWNEHHKYYQYKKQLCIDEMERERRAAAAKGPISFSIKPKDVQKPKIEYRTNVIYKQSVETGESEDEEFEGNETEENSDGNQTECKGEDEKEKSESQTEEESEEDIEEQMKSIQAAKEEAQRLEAESQYQREKQLQEERRRKASLFISMLKKTKVSEGTGQDVEQNFSSQTKRKFTERKRPSDTKLDMFEDKRSRDGNDEVIASGVGAPSADIIKVTQDLMAKVRAASRTNR